ncbi:MAG: hypothetical protein KJO79_08410, partial [Verrucomicrobiae bacterium]|nr:hypothetical protein [Verrucomicrobiae bacterium]
ILGIQWFSSVSALMRQHGQHVTAQIILNKTNDCDMGKIKLHRHEKYHVSYNQISDLNLPDYWYAKHSGG